ncbi:MAG: hypothetical protein R3Y19_01025 [Rikenellaceae bacterium]
MVRNNIIKKAVLLLVALLPLVVSAQKVKVLESSSRKAPAWLVSTGNGYFVSSNVDASLEGAKAMCLDDIKRQIISAVAENVKMSTSQETQQITNQNEIEEFNEEFIAKFETRSAVVPYLNGISLSKATDFYYQKTLNKTTGVTSYSYSVLYPFSDAELQVLIAKFNAQDKEMEQVLNDQISLLGNITSTEDIDRAMDKLLPLLDYFFDDVRLSKTQQTYDAFKKQYSNISLELVESKPGSMTYSLMLSGRAISSAVKPTFRYNCALNVMSSSAPDNMTLVSYDNGGCIDGESNWIEVSYRFPYTSLKKQFYPVMTNSPLDVSVTGAMVVALVDLDSSEGTYGGANVEFQLDNRSQVGVVVDAITLEVGELSQMIRESALNITLESGINNIQISSEGKYSLKEQTVSSLLNHLSFVKGSLSLVNCDTGLSQTIPLVIKYQLSY